MPGARQLMLESWRMFTATWSQTTRITIWFLYVGLASFAVSVLAKFNPWAALLDIPVQIAAVVISLWCGIRLFLALLDLVDSKPAGDLDKDSSRAWGMFLPMVVIGLLQGLVTFGGFILLIVPGIYLSIALAYSQLAYIDQGIRGWQALTFSRELVRGRWWGVFWRNLVSSLVMGLGLSLIVLLMLGLFGLVAGPERFFAMADPENEDPLLNGAASLLDGTLQAAFLPFILGFQVRMYRMLQKTR